MKDFIFISGATGGLGSALVTEFARRGYNLLLTDLRDDVSGFADFVAKTFNIEARGITCDLTSPQARADLLNTLKLEGVRFRGLVNVAGLDHEGAFLERTRDQIMQLIRLNIEATIDLTHDVINLRDPETRFMLINVCSLAAVTPMPYKATYAATKRFLLDLSLAIREEIKEFGTVTALCPAGMPTTVENMEGIFAQGFWGAVTTVDTRAVARMTVDAAEKGKAVVVPGWVNRMIYDVSRLLPALQTTRITGSRWRAAQQVNDPWKEYMRAVKIA